MFKVWFINFGYYSSNEFADLETAIAHGKDKGFEFRVERGGKIIASWSAIAGLRYGRVE